MPFSPRPERRGYVPLFSLRERVISPNEDLVPLIYAGADMITVPRQKVFMTDANRVFRSVVLL